MAFRNYLIYSGKYLFIILSTGKVGIIAGLRSFGVKWLNVPGDYIFSLPVELKLESNSMKQSYCLISLNVLLIASTCGITLLSFLK